MTTTTTFHSSNTVSRPPPDEPLERQPSLLNALELLTGLGEKQMPRVAALMVVTIFAVSMQVACGSAPVSTPYDVSPTPVPTRAPKPDLEITSEKQTWALVMRADDPVIMSAREPICDDPASVDTDALMVSVRDRYAGRVGFDGVELSRAGLHDARETYCAVPEPTATAVVRRVVVTATRTPTPYIPPEGAVGSDRKDYDETPQPFRLTATPTPIPTPTYPPYPYPVHLLDETKYIEPEYIGLAEIAVGGSNRERDQIAIWGRVLWEDEVRSIRSGIVIWTAQDFQRRCVMPDGQHAAVLEVVKERFPDAVYRYNQSNGNYLLMDWHLHGRNYDYNFFDRLTLPRAVESLYSFVDGNGKSRWIKTEVEVDFMDCSATFIKRGITDHATIWKSNTNTRHVYDTPPLQPDEVLSGDPSRIICRWNCD